MKFKNLVLGLIAATILFSSCEEDSLEPEGIEEVVTVVEEEEIVVTDSETEFLLAEQEDLLIEVFTSNTKDSLWRVASLIEGEEDLTSLFENNFFRFGAFSTGSLVLEGLDNSFGPDRPLKRIQPFGIPVVFFTEEDRDRGEELQLAWDMVSDAHVFSDSDFEKLELLNPFGDRKFGSTYRVVNDITDRKVTLVAVKEGKPLTLVFERGPSAPVVVEAPEAGFLLGNQSDNFRDILTSNTSDSLWRVASLTEGEEDLTNNFEDTFISFNIRTFSRLPTKSFDRLAVTLFEQSPEGELVRRHFSFKPISLSNEGDSDKNLEFFWSISASIFPKSEIERFELLDLLSEGLAKADDFTTSFSYKIREDVTDRKITLVGSRNGNVVTLVLER